MQRNKVLLVDPKNNPLGIMDKMEAHQRGLLHRAFSIFIFNSTGQMLLQQRAAHKYHGANLWTNACCSHPQAGEDVHISALERLSFEMGMQCDIQEVFSLLYHSPVENGLIEHEYDHVFIGFSDQNPVPNPTEVQNYRWADPTLIEQEISEQSERYTVWFRKALGDVLKEVRLLIDLPQF